MNVMLAVTTVTDVNLVGTDWWANASVIAAGVLAAAIAAGVGVFGYRQQKETARRDQRAQVYAAAVQAVEDYMEFPYRIRRRDGSVASRSALTQQLSDVKSSIEYHQALLSIHAPVRVAELYGSFAGTARTAAGPVMTEAWGQSATHTDADVPLGRRLDRAGVDAARDRLITAMREDLGNGPT